VLLIGQVSNHDSSVSDGEGRENYMYKWPWIDQHAYNMSASGMEGEQDIVDSLISNQADTFSQ